MLLFSAFRKLMEDACTLPSGGIFSSLLRVSVRPIVAHLHSRSEISTSNA